MIRTIEIRKTATFDNSGIEVSEFNKVNFIYGANGSGKTTISNLIYNPNDQKFNDCNLRWFDDLELKKLVYNKEFRDRNFGNGTIPGVFTLGQATKEEAELIEEKRKVLNVCKEKGLNKATVLETTTQKKVKLEEDFKETVWSSIYKKYEIEFKESFKGVIQKKLFSERLISEFNNNVSDLKDIENLRERAKTILGESPEKMLEIQNIDFNILCEIESDKIWEKKIIGKTDIEIGKLIQVLNSNDWVHQGIKYIDETNICPFCQEETISTDFKNQLEEYFDESFIDATNKVRKSSDEYLRVFENLINQLQQIDNKEKLNKISKLNLDRFTSLLKTLSSLFVGNRELLNSKIKEPSRDIKLTSTSEQFRDIGTLIDSTNDAVREHNIIVANYDSEREKLGNEIWKYIVEDNRVNIDDFLRNKNGLEQGVSNLANEVTGLRSEYRNLDIEIKELTKNLTSVQPSVDEINKTLGTFGFQNFKIVPSKKGNNQYQILRENGDLAESTLSEGEITFITFLYYLQLAKGSTIESEVTDERVLIIDDPISSLDSNVLFIVSSLLKEIIRKIRIKDGNIKQLILLTHNVYFHKEVSFINGRTKQCNKTNYWILRKEDNVSSLEDYKLVNPIQNSYELLWQELRNSENNSGITVQNIMRRIIENYFKILGKYGDDDLINSFENSQDKDICRSLICWINEGSHTIPDDLFVEQQSNTTNNYFRIFEQIFKETKHHEHYKMMMFQEGDGVVT